MSENYVKHPAVIEAELKAKIARLEDELRKMWEPTLGAIVAFVLFIAGLLIGTVL